jgi:hypothetical protein
MHRTGCKSAILLQIATKSKKNTLDARYAEHALWPVVACYAVKKFSHVFTLSLLSSSQDSPGYRDPTLNLFLNLTSELLTKPTLLAILRNSALSCCLSFGGILEHFTLSLRDTLYTLYITWYPLYLRNSLG